MMTTTHELFPSNPITKHFVIKRHVASSGPELIWKIYDAIHLDTNKACSVFLFEKYIADKLHKPRRREIVTHMLKREVKLLMQLKHPNLLQVIWPVEETNDNLAFAAEPVTASLANLLGNHTRMPQPIPSEITNFQLDDMARKLCLYQITSTLRFLHSGQGLFHNNISPVSILLTPHNQWKLTGLAFLEIIKDDKSESPRLKFFSSKSQSSSPFDPSFSPWTRKLPKMARPDTHFAAPECLFITSGWTMPFGSKRVRPTPEGRASEQEPFVEGYTNEKHSKINSSFEESRTTNVNEIPGPWSDMFSLGLVICSLYSIGEPSPLSLKCTLQAKEANGNSSMDKKDQNIQPLGEFNMGTAVSKEKYPDIVRAKQLRMDMHIPESFRKTVDRMPLELVEPVEKMLSRSTQRRPTSQLFSLLKYFNDPCLHCLYILGNFVEKSEDEKYKCLDVLRTHLDEFPKSILYERIVPMLIDGLKSCYSVLPTSEVLEAKNQPTFTIDPPQQCPVELRQSLISTFACILQHASPREYVDHLETTTTEFVGQCSCIESRTELLVNIYAFTKHASAQTIEQLFVPIVCQCLKSNNEEAMLAAMESLKEMSAYFQQSDLDDLVLQNVLKAYKVGSGQMKIAALESMCLLIRQISQDTLQRCVLPFLLESMTKISEIKTHRHSAAAGFPPDDICATPHLLPNLCNVWKEITSTRPMALEPKLITNQVFPSILAHLLDKDLNLTQFRNVISTLYALLGVLDLTICGPETSSDNTQYRTIPAVTINAPGGSEYGDEVSDAGTDLGRDRSPSASPRASTVREAVPFVPMLHPNQLRELQLSPNLPRRASAHVIFPLPMDDNSKRSPLPSPTDQSSTEKSKLGSTSFLGLKLPSVTNLRRHSCDTDRPTNNGHADLPRMEVSVTPDTNSRRGSTASTNTRFSFVSKTEYSTDALLSSENSLLTARVCEGPFISAPSSRSSSQRRSSAVAPDALSVISGQQPPRRCSRNDISRGMH